MFSSFPKLFVRVVVARKEFLKVISLSFRSSASSLSGISNSGPVQIFKNPSLPEYKNTPRGSRYFPTPPIEVADSKIRNYLSENDPRTFDEWQEAKNIFYTEIYLISDVNFSSVVMSTILSMNRLELGQSFIQFLEKIHLRPNFLAYLQYISLCSKNVDCCGQEVILDTFNKIQKHIDNTPILDNKSGLYIVQGLCASERWQEAFDFIKKLASRPTLEMKLTLASAAIRNKNEFLAWDIVTNWISDGETLNNQIVKDFLNYANDLLAKDKRKADDFISKLFQLLNQKRVTVNKEVISLIEYYFNNHSTKWSILHSKVSRLGVCESCGRNLELVELSNEEFKYLKESFLEKSVKKHDIFINTTAEEFNKFITFIEKHRPFHIVIDGLNVAHTSQTYKTKYKLAQQLHSVVRKLSGKSRKILVLGRKHMKAWPLNIMRKISDRASIFLTSDISQDDPFTVYAAFASGPYTYVVTMDLMRDHVSRLEDSKLIFLFKKWQQSHQILVSADENEELKLTEPVMHDIIIQGSMQHGWHIPYDDNILLDAYEELNNWLCIQKIDD